MEVSMDKNLIIQARRANLEEYLKATGNILLKEGKQFRVKNHSGLVVSGNRWYSHSLSKGGNSLDYLIEMEHLDFKKAIEYLLNRKNTIKTETPLQNKRIIVPQRNINDKRVIAYLVKTRMISQNVIIPLIMQGRIYESIEYHNCVFTGIDEYNNIKYVTQRSSLPNCSLRFESMGSDKKYSFSIKGKTDIVCVFESPIDLLSYRTIYHGTSRIQSHMLSLGGVSSIALDAYIERNPQIKNIVFCLDNDATGNEAYISFQHKYLPKGFNVYKHFPQTKDWNLQITHKS